MESLSVTHVRSPLSPSTNSPAPTAIPASTSTTADRAPSRRQVHRKASLSYHKKDSSEELPSSNGSIYNAHSYSKSNSADSNSKAENTIRRVDTEIAASTKAVTDDDQPNWESWDYHMQSSDHIVGVTPFIYGQGTRLDTIIEKNSNSTMQTLSQTRSTGAISSSTSTLSMKASFEKSRLQRKRSFSLDDVSSLETFLKHSYHAAITSAAGVRLNSSRIDIHDIYAQPKKPLLEPPPRPETPPGMPSWTANQQRQVPNRTSSATRGRMMNWWHFQKATPSRIPTICNGVQLPRGMSPIPRFRPPRSAYGALDTHPFSRIPLEPKAANSRKPKSSGITVRKTWTVEYSPALASPDNPSSSKPSMSELPRAIHLNPSFVGNSEVPSSTLSHTYGWDPLTSGATSSSNCISTSVLPKNGKISSHYRHNSLMNRHSILGPPIKTNITEPAASPISPQDGHDPISSSAISAPTTPDDEDCSARNVPRSPASETYLVPVTDIEAEKKKCSNHARCFSCQVKNCLSELGAWIDRTGENMERWMDDAAREFCLICCGFIVPEEEEVADLGATSARRDDGNRQGRRREQVVMLGPRQVGFAEVDRL